MKNFVTRHYNSLTYFKVGALRSKEEESQFQLQGTLHRDYPDDVNNKVPDKRPQSIIVSLDPFNLIYQSEFGDDSLQTVSVNSGQAILFSSSQCGGSNGTHADQSNKYRLFAYIVSEESDYPSEVATKVNTKWKQLVKFVQSAVLDATLVKIEHYLG